MVEEMGPTSLCPPGWGVVGSDEAPCTDVVLSYPDHTQEFQALSHQTPSAEHSCSPSDAGQGADGRNIHFHACFPCVGQLSQGAAAVPALCQAWGTNNWQIKGVKVYITTQTFLLTFC